MRGRQRTKESTAGEHTHKREGCCAPITKGHGSIKKEYAWTFENSAIQAQHTYTMRVPIENGYRWMERALWGWTSRETKKAKVRAKHVQRGVVGLCAYQVKPISAIKFDGQRGVCAEKQQFPRTEKTSQKKKEQRRLATREDMRPEQRNKLEKDGSPHSNRGAIWAEQRHKDRNLMGAQQARKWMISYI